MDTLCFTPLLKCNYRCALLSVVFQGTVEVHIVPNTGQCRTVQHSAVQCRVIQRESREQRRREKC